VAAQISRDERRRLADLVIDNSGGRDALEGEIDRAWTWLQAQAARV
jgi:dephospho-CoA kinase